MQQKLYEGILHYFICLHNLYAWLIRELRLHPSQGRSQLLKTIEMCKQNSAYAWSDCHSEISINKI